MYTRITPRMTSLMSMEHWSTSMLYERYSFSTYVHLYSKAFTSLNAFSFTCRMTRSLIAYSCAGMEMYLSPSRTTSNYVSIHVIVTTSIQRSVTILSSEDKKRI